MLLLEYLTLHMWLVLYLYWPATGLDDSNESALAFIIEPALQIHHSLLSGSHSCSPVHFPSKTCTFPPLRFSPILRSLFVFLLDTERCPSIFWACTVILKWNTTERDRLGLSPDSC